MLLAIGECLPARAAPPQRIVSINLCTDEFLLELAGPGTIVSLSFVAADPTVSTIINRARQYPPNRGSAEELVALHPDLVVAMAGREGRTRFLLDRLGIPHYELAIPDSIAALRARITELARRLGEPERGAALLARLDRALHGPAPLSVAKAPRALFYEPNGFTFGPGTVVGEAVRVAGWRDAAADFGIADYGEIPLERVVANPPDRLVVVDSGGTSNAQRMLRHPVLGRVAHMAQTSFPQALLLCPGPWTVEAIRARLTGQAPGGTTQ